MFEGVVCCMMRCGVWYFVVLSLYRVLFCGFVWCPVCMLLYRVVQYYVWYIIQRGVVEESYLTHGFLFTELNESIINPYWKADKLGLSWEQWTGLEPNWTPSLAWLSAVPIVLSWVRQAFSRGLSSPTYEMGQHTVVSPYRSNQITCECFVKLQRHGSLISLMNLPNGSPSTCDFFMSVHPLRGSEGKWTEVTLILCWHQQPITWREKSPLGKKRKPVFHAIKASRWAQISRQDRTTLASWVVRGTISKEDLWVSAVEMGVLSVQDHTHKKMKTVSIVSPFKAYLCLPHISLYLPCIAFRITPTHPTTSNVSNLGALIHAWHLYWCDSHRGQKQHGEEKVF